MMLQAFILAIGMAVSGGLPLATLDTSENPWSLQGPAAVGRELFADARYADLEKLARQLLASRARMVDGRLQLDLLESGIEELMEQWQSMEPGATARKLEEWRKAYPGSAYRPILQAMYLRTEAWNARGTDYASKVSADGWKIFKERNAQAWQLLMDTREVSSAFPAWYSQAIALGFESDKPREEMAALFAEGIQKFPGHLSLYFTYLSYLQPKWGGSYEQIDEFVKREVDSQNNPEGEALYARMYWFLEQCERCGRPRHTGEPKVDWKRMRPAFDALVARYPESKRDQAAYTYFACLAKDKVMYPRLRMQVDAAVFDSMFPLQLQECDSMVE